MTDKDLVTTPGAESGRVVRVEDLGELIRRRRRNDGTTLERAAAQSGVSAATLSRLERQRLTGAGDGATKPPLQPDTRTLAALTRWLNVSIDRVMDVNPPSALHVIVHREGETVPDMFDAHLRADPNLDSGTAAALGRMFRVAYEQFSTLQTATDGPPAEASLAVESQNEPRSTQDEQDQER